MYRARKPVPREKVNELRADFYAKIDRGELGIADAVKAMRKLSGLTQVEFAAHRGVSLRVVQETERGIGNPTVESLNKLASIFGLEVAFVRSKRGS